jgi:hypothetical protein
MSLYGVEWDMKVGSYRFDVGYDMHASCGLDQRDGTSPSARRFTARSQFVPSSV